MKPSLTYCRNCGCSSCPNETRTDRPSLGEIVRGAVPTVRTWFACAVRLAVAGVAYLASMALPPAASATSALACKIALLWAAVGLLAHAEGKLVSGFADWFFGRDTRAP